MKLNEERVANVENMRRLKANGLNESPAMLRMKEQTEAWLGLFRVGITRIQFYII